MKANIYHLMTANEVMVTWHVKASVDGGLAVGRLSDSDEARQGFHPFR